MAKGSFPRTGAAVSCQRLGGPTTPARAATGCTGPAPLFDTSLTTQENFL